jgi:ribosomal protein S18 acetylase RimI-like enzyme
MPGWATWATARIALLLLTRRSYVWAARWNPEASAGDDLRRRDIVDVQPLVPLAPYWTVDFAWVLPAFRRPGIGRILLQEASRFTRTPAADLAWRTPFSAAGQKLVRSLCPERFYIGQ